MDSTSVGYFVGAAAAWVAFAYTIRDLGRSPRAWLRLIVGTTLLLVAAVMTLSAPVSIGLVNDWTGVANFSVPLVYSLIVAQSVSAQLLVVYWKGPDDQAWPQARWWLLGCGIAMAAIVLLFVAGDAPVEQRIAFDTYYANTPYIRELIVIRLVANAVTFASIAWVCHRWTKVAGPTWLRRGLRLILIGALLGLAVDVSKLVAVVARWFGANLDFLSSNVAPAIATVATVVGTAGFILPMSAKRLSKAATWLSGAKAYRALHPLWSAMREATPGMLPGVRLPWWDLDLRLTRRLAEIADGRLVLRSHMDPELTPSIRKLGRETGLSGSDLEAMVEATRLRAAIAAKNRDLRFVPVSEDDAVQQDEMPGGTDAASQLPFYVKVSRAYQLMSTDTATNQQIDQSIKGRDESEMRQR
jgi:hypothetical protein